jgi:hypothetical protein
LDTLGQQQQQQQQQHWVENIAIEELVINKHDIIPCSSNATFIALQVSTMYLWCAFTLDVKSMLNEKSWWHPRWHAPNVKWAID